MRSHTTFRKVEQWNENVPKIIINDTIDLFFKLGRLAFGHVGNRFARHIHYVQVVSGQNESKEGALVDLEEIHVPCTFW